MAKKPKSSEINPGPGFRVKTIIERPPQATIDKCREFETPDLSDIMNRLYCMSADIKNQVNDKPLVGPACTVKVFPGDNLMVHKALDVAQPGDVIVVDASGSDRNAILGDLVTNKAKHRGIAGFVVDGLVRDLRGLQEVGLPIYAKGITPIGPLHRGPGEINFSVSCGGIVVNPGDIIVADCNGVVVIRQDFADDVLDRASASKESLSHYVSEVKKGNFSNDWVDESLQESQCRFED